MQVSEASRGRGNAGGGGGHPGPDAPGRGDPAQGHARRYYGDGEEHRLPDRRRTASKVPNAGAPAGPKSQGAGGFCPTDSSDLCPGEQEGGAVGREVWTGQEGTVPKGRQEAFLHGGAHAPARRRNRAGNRKESPETGCPDQAICPTDLDPDPGRPPEGGPDPGAYRGPDEGPAQESSDEKADLQRP